MTCHGESENQSINPQSTPGQPRVDSIEFVYGLNLNIHLVLISVSAQNQN